MAARNYRREYDKFHSSAQSRGDRSSRNKARRKLAKAGKIRKGDGKDVAHRDGRPRNNKAANLRVTSRGKNRGRK